VYTLVNTAAIRSSAARRPGNAGGSRPALPLRQFRGPHHSTINERARHATAATCSTPAVRPVGAQVRTLLPLLLRPESIIGIVPYAPSIGTRQPASQPRSSSTRLLPTGGVAVVAREPGRTLCHSAIRARPPRAPSLSVPVRTWPFGLCLCRWGMRRGPGARPSLVSYSRGSAAPGSTRVGCRHGRSARARPSHRVRSTRECGWLAHVLTAEAS
jgi:hypothetical protein